MNGKRRQSAISQCGTYLVTTMKERDKLIAKMKGSMYSLSMDELVKRAIDAYETDVTNINCPYCKSETVVSSTERVIYEVAIAGQNHEVEIKNYPRNFCRVCDKQYKNVRTSSYLHELINMKVFHSLRYEGNVPKSLDFKDLLDMSGNEAD